jgi:hypothetical protein
MQYKLRTSSSMKLDTNRTEKHAFVVRRCVKIRF